MFKLAQITQKKENAKRILAWDTSSKTGTLVAFEWFQGSRPHSISDKFNLVCEWTLSLDTAQHSERLLWSIHQVLESCGWELESIDAFGVGIGPGSFTGLRIGMTTARTLAQTLGKPLVGVSSLAVLVRPLALQYAEYPKKTHILAVTDAAKGELFALWGQAKTLCDCAVTPFAEDPGLWKRGAEEEVIDATQLIKKFKKKIGDDSHWIAIGEAVTRYPDLLKELPKNTKIESTLPQTHQIQARYLALVVWEAYQAGLARPALSVFPRYLRASDAEVKLSAKLALSLSTGSTKK